MLAAVVASLAIVAGPVPASLVATESAAEDIVDVALASDRSGVGATAASLRSDARGSAASLARAGVPKTEVAQLQQRAAHVVSIARNGSFVEVALAANAVSQLVPDL